MILLLLAPQGTPATGIRVGAVLSSLMGSLNARAAAELVFWTEAELYAFTDEAAKRLARLQGGFVERDTSQAVTDGQAGYVLPTRHLSTIHVSVAGVALRESSVQELEALDDDWPDTEATGAVERWLADLEGLELLRLYPKPRALAEGTLAVVFHRYPQTVAAAEAVVTAPRCLQEYFFFHALGEARAKESKAAMPEVAAWAREMAGLYEQVCREYWGGAQ